MARARYCRSSTTSYPYFFASSRWTLALSDPNSVSSFMMPTVLSVTPRFLPKSRKKSNMVCVKCSSWGEVRKNHLKPRLVRPGEDDWPLTCGMPYRSATWLTVAVTLECHDP